MHVLLYEAKIVRRQEGWQRSHSYCAPPLPFSCHLIIKHLWEGDEKDSVPGVVCMCTDIQYGSIHTWFYSDTKVNSFLRGVRHPTTIFLSSPCALPPSPGYLSCISLHRWRSEIDEYNCGNMVDDDLPALKACFDSAGRNGIVEM